MYLGSSAARHPDKAALIFDRDDTVVVSYGELDRRSNRLAQALRAWGLRPGDSIAVLMANEEHFFDFYWAALRSGLYFTPVNWHLSPDEMRYIVDDCDAVVLVASVAFREQAASFAATLPKLRKRISVGGAIASFEPYERLVAEFPATTPG